MIDCLTAQVISNSSDALDKISYINTITPGSLGDVKELEIRIRADKANRILELRDTGVGMTKDDLIKVKTRHLSASWRAYASSSALSSPRLSTYDSSPALSRSFPVHLGESSAHPPRHRMQNLGTIAKSGTSAFVDEFLKNNDTQLIGQFGVGFYSVFLVADHVDVVSKHNDDAQHIWSSSGQGSFTITEDDDPETQLGRGTMLRLHLKEDADEFLEERKIRELVKTYSQYINYPILLEVEKEVEKEVPVDEFDDVSARRDPRRHPKLSGSV